jgi:hypothetical protein
MQLLPLILATSLCGAQLPQDPARIQIFEAVPRFVKAGEAVELRWSATGTEQVRLEPLEQFFPPVGQVIYVPRERTVFWLHATNARGGQSIPVVVEILPATTDSGPWVGARSEHPQPRVVPSEQGIWIQLAALADTTNAERLNLDVSRRTGLKVVLSEIEPPDQPGLVLHRLRIGPFASIREARSRLRSLQPKLRILRLKPIVVVN